MVQIITFLFGVIYWKEIALIALFIIIAAFIVSCIKNNHFTFLPLQGSQEPIFDTTCMSDIDELSGPEFEHFCAFYLRKNGYSDVEVTPNSNDKGIDVLATKKGYRYAVQCKRYSGNVSRSAVSDAFAGKRFYGCDYAVVFTNSYLSKDATEMAKKTFCEVIDRDAIAGWINKTRLDPIHTYQSRLSNHQNNNEFDRPEPIGLQTIQTSESDESCPKVNKIFGEQTKTFGKRNSAKITVNNHSPDTCERNAKLGGQEIIRSGVNMVYFSELDGNIKSEIKTLAEKEHPNDYSTQLYVANEAVTSYIELLDLQSQCKDKGMFVSVARSAHEDHGADYSTVLYVVKDQLDAHKQLSEF